MLLRYRNSFLYFSNLYYRSTDNFCHLQTISTKLLSLLPYIPYLITFYIPVPQWFSLSKIVVLCLYLLQTHFGISSFSHTDNALELCGLLTPLHIVPEWYFLCQYAMLKAVPNKNAGFIILLTSIFTFFLLGEIRNLTTLSLLPLVNNCFSLSSFFQSLLSFLHSHLNF